MEAREPPSRATNRVLLLALLLALPSLALGFGVDEHGFRAALATGHTQGSALYRFATGDAARNRVLVAYGLLPWWTASGFKLHFLRPFASLLFAADDRWFGAHAWLYHLHSLLWYGVLLLLAARLFRNVLPARPALFALAVYALKNAHVQAYASPAARHVTIAAVGSALALVVLTDPRALVAWRRRLAAFGSLAFALSASEAGLMGVGFWISFELWGEGARSGGTSETRRWMRVALPASLGAAYLVVYRALGAGAAFGGGYRDPLAEPLEFARAFPRRLFVALGDALAGVPSELALGRPVAPLVGVGLLATVLVGYVLWRAWPGLESVERRALGWLSPASIIAVVLGLGGLPTGRVLLVADLGFAALLGVLIDVGRRGPVRLPGAAPSLIALHLGIAPLLGLATLARSYRVARASERIARTLPLGPDTRRAFVIASDPYAFLYARGVLADEGRRLCWSVLSAARADHSVQREQDGSLEIEAARPLGAGPFETLFRAPELPFAAGDAFRQCGAEIRVLSVEDGHVKRFAVRAPERGDSAFLFWNGKRFESLELPAPGATKLVAWMPGPARIF